MKKPDFLLQKVRSDGSSDPPMLYSIEEIEGRWKMGRRGFLATSASLLGLIAGCASSPPTAPDKKQVEKAPSQGKAKETQTGTLGTKPIGKNKALSSRNPQKTVGGCGENITAHRMSVETIVFTPDGKHLVSGSRDRAIKYWDFPSGKLVRRIDEAPSSTVAIQGGTGRLLASPDPGSKGVMLIDVASGRKIRDLKESRFDYVNALDFSPDGRTLACGRVDRTLTIWSIPSCNRQKKIKIDAGEVTAVAYSPDGRFLASAAAGEIVLWSVPEYRKYRVFPVNDFSVVRTLRFSPDSRLLASGGTSDTTVKIWNITGPAHVRNLKGHEYSMDKIFAFSPDSRFIATSKGNNEATVWDIATGTSKLVLRGKRMHDRVESIVFSPDGGYLITGTYLGTIKIWKFPSGYFQACLFDTATLEATKKVNQYTATNAYGQLVTYTLPCGSPIPQGARCVCNCVPGGWTINRGTVQRKKPPSSSGSRTYCSCNLVCTCVPVYY